MTVALALGVMSSASLAQAPGGDGGGNRRGNNNPGGGQPGGGQPGGGFGGRDMTQWRAAMNERLKTELGATDDEFKALQPKIEKVLQLQRDLNAGRFRGFQRPGQGGPGGGQPGQGGPGGGQPGGQPGATPAAGGDAATPPANPVATANRELQDMLENKDAKPDEIKAKLEALRTAKTKVREELTKAQSELKELLSQRQEAVLVTNGTLD